MQTINESVSESTGVTLAMPRFFLPRTWLSEDHLLTLGSYLGIPEGGLRDALDSMSGKSSLGYSPWWGFSFACSQQDLNGWQSPESLWPHIASGRCIFNMYITCQILAGHTDFISIVFLLC